MTELFYTILNMSISAGILILAVLLLRLFFRRAPKWVSVLLWGLVAVRLILPFIPESALSLMPKAEWVTPDTFYTEENTYFDSTEPVWVKQIPVDAIVGSGIGPDVTVRYYPLDPPIEIHRGVSPVFVLSCIWLAGIAAMLVYMLVSYIRVMRCVHGARQFRDNIYTSESVASPFVLGTVRPRIYLPESMDAVSMSYVIAHEEAHLRRLDHLWKPFGFLLLAIHWFNPLIWIGYILLCRDIEMACDERVVRGMNEEERADYSEALLACSVSRKMISACPLAFGEIGAKARIKTVLNYKKPAFWIVILAVIASVAAAVCFLTNPITVRNPWVQEYVVGAEGILGQVDKEKYESVSEDFAIGADKYGRAVFKDPLAAFETMKELYSDGLALIAEEQNLAPISKSNYKLYKKFGWQVTSGTEETQKQAKFVSNFLDIYENSFAKDKPNTDLPKPTEEVESGKVLASHISKAQLDHEVLKQQLEEIEAHIHAVVNAEIILEYQRKFSSVVCHPETNYVTVFVRDFTEDDIRRFEEVFKDYSYVLVSADAPLNDNKEVLFPFGEPEPSKPKTDLTLPQNIIDASYEMASKNGFVDVEKTGYIIRLTDKDDANTVEIVFATLDPDVHIGIIWTRPDSEAEWELFPGTPMMIYDRARFDRTLTLEDVITLSQKGADLTWEDFAGFHYTETGSGLYIRVYEVDENFKVWIGGGSPIGTPMYIYLALADDLDTRIDIRDGGVEEFIDKYTATHSVYRFTDADVKLEDVADKEAFSSPIVCHYAGKTITVNPPKFTGIPTTSVFYAQNYQYKNGCFMLSVSLENGGQTFLVDRFGRITGDNYTFTPNSTTAVNPADIGAEYSAGEGIYIYAGNTNGDTLYGLMDNSGKTITEPRYASKHIDFSLGYAVAEKADGTRVGIDANGNEYRILPGTASIRGNTNVVQKGAPGAYVQYLYDARGNQLSDGYDSISYFFGGLALINKDNKMGLIAQDGTVVLPPSIAFDTVKWPTWGTQYRGFHHAFMDGNAFLVSIGGEMAVITIEWE